MKRLSLFATIALVCSSCCATRIVTVSPDNLSRRTYTTTVSAPYTRTVTTTTHVIAADNDIALALNLQAIGAAFAQSSTVQEFENLINSPSYMLSNLDLNGDGYIDYLRVIETVEGYAHVFVIQAVLADNVYQDVASIVAEVPANGTAYVQIIGDPYIYGPKYIIEPVFVYRPLIFAHLCRHNYNPWRSPWYWNHFPSHYRRRAPVYHGHYCAYVDTYMHNHRYCRTVRYVDVYHYNDYARLSRQFSRNDYGRLHPEHSFTERNADVIAKSRASAGVESSRTVNARALSEVRDADAVTRTAAPGPASGSAGNSTTVKSRVTNSGTSSTRVNGSSSAGTGYRSSGASGSRSSATGTATSGTRSSTSGTATRSGDSATATRSSSATATRSSSASATRSSGTSGTRSTSGSGRR